MLAHRVLVLVLVFVAFVEFDLERFPLRIGLWIGDGTGECIGTCITAADMMDGMEDAGDSVNEYSNYLGFVRYRGGSGKEVKRKVSKMHRVAWHDPYHTWIYKQ